MVGIPRSLCVVLTFINVPSFNTFLYLIKLKYDYGLGSYNYDICGYHYNTYIETEMGTN